MRLKKKTAMILSFALGTTLFATTAIAEIATKSGYDVFKNSLKYTAESLTTKLSSYTVDASFTLKTDGNIISSESSINKYDVSKQTSETSTTNINGKNKSEYYYYVDKDGRINKYDNQPIYYVTEFTTPQDLNSFTNPFKEERAEDIERIADILVGNLKDAVIVTENSDGSKELSGSLSESQIPALVNAVMSLQTKNEFRYRQENKNLIPKITKDVFVKEVTGNMLVNKGGLVESIVGTGELSGKDDNGKEHIISLELSVKLHDIDSTKVNKPDLTGKKVEKSIEKDYDKLTNPEKFIGKYKTDILVEKDGKFEKIGEKFIDLTQVTETNISGRYYEKYVTGYEDYAANKKDFKFTAKFQEKSLNADFTATDASGNTIKGNISPDEYSGKVHFDINEARSMNLLSDGQFSRVFE